MNELEKLRKEMVKTFYAYSDALRPSDRKSNWISYCHARELYLSTSASWLGLVYVPLHLTLVTDTMHQ